MLEKKIRLGVVAPVYGNEGSLEILYERIDAATRDIGVELVLQFVNDRSPDGSQAVLERLAARDPRVRVILLSRNHGSFTAIAAGLAQVADCDAVVAISADLQDPPELIPQMVARWREGKRVVLAARRKRDDPFLTKIFANSFHWLFRKIALKEMPEGGFDFFLIDRRVVQVILESSEKKTSLIGLVLWAGFDRAVLEYDRAEREHGRSMWTMGKKLSYAFNSIVAFSSFPLKLFVGLGLVMAALSALGIAYVVLATLFGLITVPGWPSVMVLQFLIFAVLFLGFGILGGYLWNNLEQTRKRPLFIIDKRIGPAPGAEAGISESGAIPFFDLRRVSAPVAASLRESALRTMGSTRIILGEAVERFERDFAALAGAEHCVGVANGTDAITLALWACGAQPGDRVVVPALTAPPTPVAVMRAGCVPVFADVDPVALLMTPDSLEAAAKDGARFAVPVHLYGNPCDMPGILFRAQKLGLTVIEDCAQSAGSMLDGKSCGRFSPASAFSFYPTKNLGAYGDAGAILTDDPEIADRLRRMRFYGQDAAGQCVMRGMNSRLDEMQAALLCERLKIFAEQNSERAAIAALYDARLGFLNPVPSLPGRIPHLYVVRPEDRDGFRRFLAERGVQTGVHYPLALNRHVHFLEEAVCPPCPDAEAACARVVSLPCYPGMPAAEAEAVTAACLAWRGANAS